MPRISCQTCGNEFYVKPNRLARGWGKYCSKTCQFMAQKSGKSVNCDNCGAGIYKNVSAQRRSKSGKFFCNKSCQTVWRNTKVYIGKDHSNWKNGMSSYRDILRRTGLAMICAKCRSVDTRVLAVHHKDKNRQNNDAFNLLWLCHNCHFLVHHYGSEAKGYLDVPV